MSEVFIDKSGGRHYHKESCVMVADTQFPYEKVEVETLPYNKPINIDGKKYYPCPGCYSEKISLRN